MRFSGLFIFLFISGAVLAHDVDKEFVGRIKKEYGVILDNLFAQGQGQLETKADIVEWLYRKNKEEFKNIQNLITDLKVELCFDCADENIVKKELQECLKEKIQERVENVLDIKKVTAENMQDFFCVSRMICNVTMESDDVCYKMMRDFKKEYGLTIKKLKIIDKADMKIKKEEKKQEKKDALAQLREQIILGSCPRK
jgi:hypothetical protein